MDTKHFDSLSKKFATRFTRRAALGKSTLALGAAMVIREQAMAQEATPVAAPASPISQVEPADDGSFLFVQTATGGTFTRNAPSATPPASDEAEYLLTLEGHSGGTIYFSDRPERIFGKAPTDQFLDGLGFTPDNPPNAALVAQTEDGAEDVVVLELFAPTYNEDAATVTYGANILSDYTGTGLAHVSAKHQGGELADTFGSASLFIDDCSDSWMSCMVDYQGKSICAGPSFKVGYCWHWESLSCRPCNSDYSAQCNDMYPDWCHGACVSEALSGC